MQLSVPSQETQRVWLAAGVVVVLAIVGLLALTAMAPSVARAQEPVGDMDAEGMAANNAWWGALVEGTVPAIDAVLAPEFQIMRADGSSYDKDDYLGSQLPDVKAIPEFSQMVVTAHDDVLIVRYFVTVQEMRDGLTVEAHAPRLTVFRKEDGKWLVAAHANFATLEK